MKPYQPIKPMYKFNLPRLHGLNATASEGNISLIISLVLFVVQVTQITTCVLFVVLNYSDYLSLYMCVLFIFGQARHACETIMEKFSRRIEHAKTLFVILTIFGGSNTMPDTSRDSNKKHKKGQTCKLTSV